MKERIDDLQRGGCHIIQRPDQFCFGMDAVLLAAWAKVKRGMRVLDLCCGNGVIPILMDARLPEEIRQAGSVQFTGVEINSISVDMANRSVQMNGQGARIHILAGDVREVCRRRAPDGRDVLKGVLYEGVDPGLEPASFDVVTLNPPYMTGGGGLTGENVPRSIARHEVLCTIDDAARAASGALIPGGHLFMVHRPHRLGDIFRSFQTHGLGIKRMRMVHPFADKEANMVLIDAAKGGRTYVHAEAPLVIFQKSGEFTEETKALYG